MNNPTSIDNDPRVTYHHDGDYWTWNINGTQGGSDMIEDVQAALTLAVCSATHPERARHDAEDASGLSCGLCADCGAQTDHSRRSQHSDRRISYPIHPTEGAHHE